MQVEYFENEIECDYKYPSKLYKCCYCNSLTADAFVCDTCGWNLRMFDGAGKSYKYKIADGPEVEIFKPIEADFL